MFIFDFILILISSIGYLFQIEIVINFLSWFLVVIGVFLVIGDIINEVIAKPSNQPVFRNSDSKGFAFRRWYSTSRIIVFTLVFSSIGWNVAVIGCLLFLGSNLNTYRKHDNFIKHNQP